MEIRLTFVVAVVQALPRPTMLELACVQDVERLVVCLTVDCLRLFAVAVLMQPLFAVEVLVMEVDLKLTEVEPLLTLKTKVYRLQIVAEDVKLVAEPMLVEAVAKKLFYLNLRYADYLIFH